MEILNTLIIGTQKKNFNKSRLSCSPYRYDSFQQIVMFSIGSGIAALYPIARAIVDDETELTRIYLVAGFQSMSQVPTVH